MNRVYFLKSQNLQRRFDESDFPLSIGGDSTNIELKGVPAKSVLAHIALSSGHAYVQSAGEEVELYHNHEYIKSSAWLKSGDRVQLGDWMVCWDIKGDQVFIEVRNKTETPELKAPPVLPPVVENEPDGPEIIPIATASMSPGKQRKLRYLVFAAFTLLTVVALFVLFATPISININPNAETQTVSGFPPPVSFGQKMLVVPGTFTVNASLDGYHSLQQSFEVVSGGFQAFNFELKELPGRLKINVDPAVSIKVFLGEHELATDSGNVVSVERGLQQISIETDRYLVETRELDIAGFGELQELNIVLRPAWANVELNSVPQGAEVLVDDGILGITPLKAEIVQGQRSIEISLAGFKTKRLQELLVAGSSIVLETIKLEPNDGILKLSSRPGGATVSVAGTFHGSTPVTMILASGVDHQIRLSKPGYLSVKKTVSLQPDEEQQLTMDLASEMGIVFISSNPADATLILDGKPAGSGTQRLRLNTRPHELTFSKPGYVSQTLKVTPRTDTSQNIEIDLKTLIQAKEDARPAVLHTASGHEMPLLEPSGSFKMGASRREAGRRANESQRLVEITRPYYLATREVTNAQYRLFNSKHQSGSAEGVSLNSNNLPVVNVSWNDAARYCNWLSEQDKLVPAYVEQGGHMKLSTQANSGYRLPSEAEWAYAARVAGRNTAVRYSWGESYPPKSSVGNFADAQIADTLAIVVTGYNDGYRGPSPVGSFTAHPGGFHDLGGNVAEWTNDYYAVYPGQANKLTRDPTGPDSGDHHVVRGSSWRDGSITELRLSYRDYSRGPRDNLGFRIARYADE